MEEQLKQFKDMIDASKNIVFFGGAGVSTESGIPDFRSKDGLYNQHDVRFDMYQPEYLLSHSCLVYEPKVYYEFHRQKMDTRNIEPNNAHKYLAALEKEGKLKAIGVCNFYPHILTDFCETVSVKPAVNQVELHPFFQQENALKVMKEYGKINLSQLADRFKNPLIKMLMSEYMPKEYVAYSFLVS